MSGSSVYHSNCVPLQLYIRPFFSSCDDTAGSGTDCLNGLEAKARHQHVHERSLPGTGHLKAEVIILQNLHEVQGTMRKLVEKTQRADVIRGRTHLVIISV